MSALWDIVSALSVDSCGHVFCPREDSMISEEHGEECFQAMGECSGFP